MFEHKIFTMDLAGRELSVEIGKIAQLASGSAILRYGDTMVMVNVSKSSQPREGVDFFPLSVDYEEKLYSVGKIPGGFLKREGKASEKAILTSRLIDRPIRPLFPKTFRNDVQVVATVLSVDQDCTPDIVSMIGSSVALSISEIPFNGPTGSVCIGLVDGALVVNPTAEEREKSELHLVVSGTKEAVMMVEAGANEVPESLMLEAILKAHEEIKKIVEFIEQIQAEVGKEKMEFVETKPDAEIEAKVREIATEGMKEAVKVVEKLERQEAMDAVKEQTINSFDEETLEDLAIDDKILVKAYGQGLSIENHEDIAVMSIDPNLFEKLGITEKDGKLQVPVVAKVPAYLMGSGTGSSNAYSGDYDIMTADKEEIKRLGLDKLRFGDLVLLQDHDNTYGTGYLGGAISIGVIIHSDCVKSGHGPGVTVIMSSSKGNIEGVIDSNANIGYYMNK